MFFSRHSKVQLLKAALFKNAPVYVQFYITARCNLTCQQCNIIYANSDARECTLDEIKRVADNFAHIGVPIVLLTGGEPFVRNDLPDIIREFESRGIHVRMQTNGLASEEQIQRAVAAGGKDISISLDSLNPKHQDAINGGINRSWDKALRTMALFTKHLPLGSSFASLGCVLQRANLDDVEDVIRFGTAVGWFTSLVPVHVTDYLHPRNFRSFDQSLRFQPEEFGRVCAVIERVREMREEGYLLYDSDQYLDDVKRFVQDIPVTWRDRNAGICDSPALYFAVLPNGDFAPCCDYRFSSHVPAYGADFPRLYRSREFRKSVKAITKQCDGCMFGSFPEMTIAMRFLAAQIQRFKIFFASPPKRPWPVSYETMLATAERIRTDKKAAAPKGE